MVILPLPTRTPIDPKCSQTPSSRASARKWAIAAFPFLRPHRREQALALHLHQGW